MNETNSKLEAKLYQAFLNHTEKALYRDLAKYKKYISLFEKPEVTYFFSGVEIKRLKDLNLPPIIKRKLEGLIIIQILKKSNLEPYQVFSLTVRFYEVLPLGTIDAANDETNRRAAVHTEYIKYVSKLTNEIKPKGLLIHLESQENINSFNSETNPKLKIINVSFKNEHFNFLFSDGTLLNYQDTKFQAFLSKQKKK